MENLSVWLSILLNSIPVCITRSSSCYSKRLNSHLLFDVCKIEIQPPEIFLGNTNRARGAEVGDSVLIAARAGCMLKPGASQWSGVGLICVIGRVEHLLGPQVSPCRSLKLMTGCSSHPKYTASVTQCSLLKRKYQQLSVPNSEKKKLIIFTPILIWITTTRMINFKILLVLLACTI